VNPTKAVVNNPQARADVEEEKVPAVEKRLMIKFKNSEGDELPHTLDLSERTTIDELTEVLNKLLDNDERLPYTFFYDTFEIKKSLADFLKKVPNFTSETVFNITYHPESLFVVRPITRLASSLEGHTDSILSVAFSPNGLHLASGAGDCTVRFWDIDTETPLETCEGHKNWVLIISWSPDGEKLASGSMDNSIRIWNPADGKEMGSPLTGHSKWITSLSWEPLHKNGESRYLVSGSKDGTVRVWDTAAGSCILAMASHTACVTKVLWGGQDYIYSSSEDRTVKVWSREGRLIRELNGHGHWVNTMALHTDFALRTGCYDEKRTQVATPEARKAKALEKYEKLKGSLDERLVSGSDDHTLFLWDPKGKKEPITRMTGHQQPVNHLQYSPNAKYIISASFDKCLKLWDGFTGAFMATFRGHVGSVYQVAWAADSRLFVSASKDSTMKVWDIKTRKLMFDLPGHSDEVYSVDWSPDGEKVASGSKDRLLKIWRN
jgi:ribosome assembly protein 4